MTKPDNEFSEYETHYFNGKPEGYVTLALYHKLYAAYLTRAPSPAEAPSAVSQPTLDKAIEAFAKAHSDGRCPDHCVYEAVKAALPSHQPLAEDEAVELFMSHIYRYAGDRQQLKWDVTKAYRALSNRTVGGK